jgi:hypothetical protein
MSKQVRKVAQMQFKVLKEQISTRSQSKSGNKLAPIAMTFFTYFEIPILGYEGHRVKHFA